MQTETEKAGGGRSCGTLPVQNARSLNKTLSIEHPPQCRVCESEYSIQESGPDAGQKFACGIMLENMENGVMLFSCPYLKPIKPSGLMDADTLQAAARVRDAEKRIASTPFPNPPVIVAEETVPGSSPHPWMNEAIMAGARKNREEQANTRMAKNIRMFCSHCSDVDKCTIAGELSALDRCLKVSRNRAFLMSLEAQR